MSDKVDRPDPHNAIAPPDVVRWSFRAEVGHNDCAIAAIAMACGESYETVLSAAIAMSPDALNNGLNLNHLLKTIRLMGYTAKNRKKFDINDDSGILWLDRPTEKDESAHVVYLWEGRIIEPEIYIRQMWLNPEEFLKFYEYTACSLITVGDK